MLQSCDQKESIDDLAPMVGASVPRSSVTALRRKFRGTLAPTTRFSLPSLDALIATISMVVCSIKAWKGRGTRWHAIYPKPHSAYALKHGVSIGQIASWIRRGNEIGRLPPLESPGSCLVKVASWRNFPSRLLFLAEFLESRIGA